MGPVPRARCKGAQLAKFIESTATASSNRYFEPLVKAVPVTVRAEAKLLGLL
jgi:hypothetical protein